MNRKLSSNDIAYVDSSNRREGHGPIIVTSRKTGKSYTVYRRSDALLVIELIRDGNEDEANEFCLSPSVLAAKDKRNNTAARVAATHSRVEKIRAEIDLLEGQIEELKAELKEAEYEEQYAQKIAAEEEKLRIQEEQKRAAERAAAEAKKAEREARRAEKKTREEEARRQSMLKLYSKLNEDEREAFLAMLQEQMNK